MSLRGASSVTLVRVLIIGLGQAGARFLRACMAINRERPRMSMVGGVETNAGRRKQSQNVLGAPVFSSVADAARSVQADMIVISAPEVEHFNILTEVKKEFPDVRRILCEKPLVSGRSQARMIEKSFATDQVTVSLVERFSPAVEMLQSYISGHGRKVLRVNCFWGKYRAKDPRPTPGVIAVELAHPIDLALALARVAPHSAYQIRSAVAASSNISIEPPNGIVLDTLHVAVQFQQGLQLIVSSSLLWSRRQRRIELLLGDENGVARELAVIQFDFPIWDMDKCEIYDVREAGGKLTAIASTEFGREFWPKDRMTIGKVCRFVDANLDELEGQTVTLLPRLDQGVYLQYLLDDIESAARRSALTLTCFAEPATPGSVKLASQLEFLSRVNRGEGIAEEEFLWDHPY